MPEDTEQVVTQILPNHQGLAFTHCLISTFQAALKKKEVL